MKSFLFEYFRYTRAERNGILVLSALCLILLIFYHLQSTIFKEEDFNVEAYEAIYCGLIEEVEKVEAKPVSYFNFDPNTIDKKGLLSLGLSEKQTSTLINYRKAGAKIRKSSDLEKVYGFTKELVSKLAPYMKFEQKSKPVLASFGTKATQKKEFVLSRFNPNTSTKEELLNLGISSKVVNTIINFRSKVNFKKPEDFKKIYGLSNTQYERLLPYLDLPIEVKSSPKTVYEKPAFSKKEKVIIDINKADVLEWQKLNGIGPTYSERIVKFRDKLGGFYTIEQVAETFGMEDSTFQMIKPYLKNEVSVSKININLVELDELRSHPYLKWKHAKVLINYRKHHGPFNNKEDLMKVKVLSEEQVDKVLPYLSFE